MADLTTTTVVMLVSGLWGAIGGFIWWAIPERPRGSLEFAKRVGVGWVAGTLVNVFDAISPFDTAGAWDTANVGKLVVAGFMGLATIAAFFPKELNQNVKAVMEPKGEPG